MTRSETSKDIDTIRDDVQALRKDLQDLKSDLKGLLHSVKDSGQNKVNGARERVLEAARCLESEINDRLHSAKDVVMERGQEFAEKARDKVEEKPLTIIMGAFLVGILLERVLFRRS